MPTNDKTGSGQGLIKQGGSGDAVPHHAVRVLCEPLECEQGVVGLYHHIAHFVLVGEHRVRLHQLLGVPGRIRRKRGEQIEGWENTGLSSILVGVANAGCRNWSPKISHKGNFTPESLQSRRGKGGDVGEFGFPTPNLSTPAELLQQGPDSRFWLQALECDQFPQLTSLTPF